MSIKVLVILHVSRKVSIMPSMPSFKSTKTENTKKYTRRRLVRSKDDLFEKLTKDRTS